MMGNDQTISRDLYDLLTTQNFDPEITDQQGKPSQPDEGRVFKFDYVSNSGKNYGTAVLVVGEDNDLMFFFGDNLGKSMEEPDKTEWFQFLQQLSQFATEHRYTWSPKDLNRFKHTMAGMAAISEGLFEGYYGTRKKSYVGEPTEARLVINHNRMIGENDKRYRYVESLFIETVDGERFKLPFTKLAGGNAMLEHVRQGGRPYDIRGVHITDIVTEMSVLSRFNRARQNRVFEGVTQELVEQAVSYYKSLKENLKHLGSARGYKNYFESWSPADITTEEALVEDLKTLFVEQSIDARIEAALPTLAKIKQGTGMKEADIFENWVNNLAEGTWALPDNPEAQAKLDELMSDELIVGPDATNATEQLYDVVGDDQLFDILGQLAERDSRANIWDDTDVQRRLSELGIELKNKPENDADKELNEGHMADVDLILQDIANGDEDIYRVYSSPRTAEEQYASKIIGDMYDEVVIDKHLHPDDDFEQILDIVADRLAQEHSVNEAVMRGGDEDYEGDPDYEDRYNEDEGFFVTIGNEEGGMFLGMVTKDGGRWRETTIQGNPPHNWGSANYMSYLTPQDVKQWINKDYGRHNEVEFFDSEEEARDYFGMMSEGTGVTDYNPKSQGGTRKELLAKYHKSKDPKDAAAARKAGATQKELQGVAEGSPQSMGTALRNALSRVEPGSKLDKKIRHHNDMVRRFGPEAGTMTSAPDGYHIDKKGFVRLGEKQGVAEGEYDPSYDPEYRPYQKPEQDPDAWKQQRDLEEPSTPKTVTITDGSGKVVLTFPSTGGFYGDLRFAASKGFDTDSGGYHINWKKDVAEDGSNEMSGRDGVWDSFYESDALARIKQLALLK